MNRRQHRSEPAAKSKRAAIMSCASGGMVDGSLAGWSAVCPDGMGSWRRGGQPAERDAAHQIVRERKPEQDGARLGQAADSKLLQAAVTGNRVDAFGGAGPQLVAGLGGVGAHALAPRRDGG